MPPQAAWSLIGLARTGLCAILVAQRPGHAYALAQRPARRLGGGLLPVFPGHRGDRAEAAAPALRALELAAPQPPPQPGCFVTFGGYLPPAADHVLAAPPRIPGGLWLVKRRGCLAARSDGAFQSRAQSMLRTLAHVARRHPNLPDFGPVYLCVEGLAECRSRAPDGRIPGAVVLAIHQQAADAEAAADQRIELVPDPVFDSWPETAMLDYEATCAEIRAASDSPAERQVAGWIGNVQTNELRNRLLHMAEEHPRDLEAIDTGDWRQDDAEGPQVSVGHFVSLPELVARYAYLIDVAGRFSSFRLKALLHARRVVLIQERPFYEYWSHLLEPFVHYVPVAADLHDLPEQVAWLKRHPERAEQIAVAGQRFALTHLTRAAAVDALARTLGALDLPAADGGADPSDVLVDTDPAARLGSGDPQPQASI